jgi:putative phosphoesterase
MRIGVIADTHIPERAKEIPQQVLEAFKQTDMIIHAGDLADLSVLEKLKSLCKTVKAVSGNMDHNEVKARLPEKEIIEIANYRIGVMHGYGAPANLIELLELAFKNDKVDVVIFGHSHTALNEKKGNILYFNPGSPTDKIFSPYNSYGIIEINNKIEAKIIKI